jgi:hypothetical protein
MDPFVLAIYKNLLPLCPVPPLALFPSQYLTVLPHQDITSTLLTAAQYRWPSVAQVSISVDSTNHGSKMSLKIFLKIF